MFLGREQILERLRRGDLVIDPIVAEEQIGTFTVDLRFGTQFIKLAARCEPHEATEDSPTTINTIKLGDAVRLPANSRLLFVPLEYLKIPPDLAGVLLPMSSHMRLGLATGLSHVEPGFEGRLTVAFSNLGPFNLEVHSGIRMVCIALAQVLPHTSPGLASIVGPHAARFHVDDADGAEVGAVESLFLRNLEEARSQQTSGPSIRDLLTEALRAKPPDKGKALERLAVRIFETIKGIKVVSVNPRLLAEELDILLENNITNGFWRLAGSPILVECKNWSGKVGAAAISVLAGNLATMSTDAKTGILIAPNGVSGDSYSDARLKIREQRQRGRYIIVIDGEALEEIASGAYAAEVISRKYNEVLLI